MRTDSMVAAIVLAAGASTRMGEAKPLVELGGRPLLEHILFSLRSSSVGQIIVVLGHEAERVRRGVDLDGAMVIINPDYQRGMSTSLHRGLEALTPSAAAFLVALGDQPFVSPSTLDSLLEAWRDSKARIVIPTFQGIRGNPVLIDRSLVDEVGRIAGDQGCRAIFGAHDDEIVEVPVPDAGILFDVDSRGELEEARSVIQGHALLGELVAGRAPRPSGNPLPLTRSMAPRGRRRVDVDGLAAELRSRNEPFALATVVRAVKPTSGKPGYKAVVLPTGELIGWIGGSCSRSLVIQECLAALQEARPRFLRFSADRDPMGGEEGIVEHLVECRSGGTMDIYVEPNLPRPHLLIVGDSPVAGALATLGRLLNYRVTVAAPQATEEAFPDADQVITDLQKLREIATPGTYAVVATMQKYDAQALSALAGSPAVYVALVASRRRGGALLQDLRRQGAPVEALARVRNPAGLDVAAETPEEIALSIMAEITQVRHTAPVKGSGDVQELPPSPSRPIDVVCGMEVEEDNLLQATHGGRVYYFCSDACRLRFVEAPEDFLR